MEININFEVDFYNVFLIFIKNKDFQFEFKYPIFKELNEFKKELKNIIKEYKENKYFWEYNFYGILIFKKNEIWIVKELCGTCQGIYNFKIKGSNLILEFLNKLEFLL